MNTRQRLFILFVGIAIGYGFHDSAYYSSQWLLKSIHILPNKQPPQTVLGQSSDDIFITTVTYDGTQFRPRRIQARTGNYIMVTNNSKTVRMWLQSDMPSVATTRGYAEGEQFQFSASSVGTFTIGDKLNPDASFQLTVIE